jgi:hypothetical protein
MCNPKQTDSEIHETLRLFKFRHDFTLQISEIIKKVVTNILP